MAVVESELQQLLHKQAITERIYDYARSMDRLDVELGRSVFHPDARADYGAGIFQGTGHGFVEQMCTVFHPQFKTHAHQFSNIRIWLDSDTAARSETYCDAAVRLPDVNGGWQDLRTLGRYLDRWQKRDGEWRIADRVFVIDFDRIEPSAAMSEPTGKRDRTDPSYFRS